jgi:hypothetical protein
MSERKAKCPRCGDEITAWKSEIFRGWVAGCRPCFDNDVEQWRVAGAVPVRFAPTQRLALEAWKTT